MQDGNTPALVPRVVDSRPPGVFKRLAQAVAYALAGGYFSPQNPPQAQQQQTAGRRFDYMPGYNLQIRPTRESGITFETLRALSATYDILRLVIQTRKDQVSALEWGVVPVEEEDGVRRDVQRQIDKVKRVLKRPDGRMTWTQWLRAILEDVFVLDAIALWPVYNGKELVALEIVDPSTIKIVIDESGRIPRPPQPAYQQIIKGVPASNFTRDELLYFIENPRSNTVYGYSRVEHVIVTADIGLRREMSQREYFTEGNIPDAIAGVPLEWTPAQIAEFQAGFDNMLAGNTAARRRLTFVPGGATKDMQWTKDIDATLKTEFDEWLARVVCYAFSVSPTPFITVVNRATAESSAEQALEEGLSPLLDFLKGVLDQIIQGPMGCPDVEFRWDIKKEIDPEAQSRIDTAYIERGVYGIDDVRERMGFEPLGIPVMIWTPSGPVPVERYADGTAPGLQPPDDGGDGGQPAPGKPGGKPDDDGGKGEEGEEDGDAAAKLQEGRPSRDTPFRYAKGEEAHGCGHSHDAPRGAGGEKAAQAPQAVRKGNRRGHR